MRRYILVGMIVATGLAGCATPLSNPEKLDYESMKQAGLLVEEKSPAAGAVLGILPGCGSFYARQNRAGITNFFLWPLSMLWDPVSGYEGAKAINYDASLRDIRARKERDLDVLDDRRRARQISNSEYQAEKERIEARYRY